MQRQVLIIGAGRSGRGMLGELYSRSNFRIIFADRDTKLLEDLKRQRYYTVKMTDLGTNESVERKITGFSCVDAADKAAYYKILNESDIISTAILPADFDEVIADLAGAIKLRFQQKRNSSPMLITLGANYVGMKRRFFEGISALLNETEQKWFGENVALLQSIVNRKNLLPGLEERTEDRCRIVGDNKGILQVERHPFLEMWDDLPDWMCLKDDLEAVMSVKIWSNNLVQGSMAAVGMKKGLTDTYACAMDTEISKWAYYAGMEGYEAVRREFNLPKRSEKSSKEMVTVFRNPQFKDSCYRIIRNPIRKLARNERFIGPALCALKHKVFPFFILKCCAYMLAYENEADPEAVKLQKDIQESGIENVIQRYCQLDMEKEDEFFIAEILKKFYQDITEENPLHE